MLLVASMAYAETYMKWWPSPNPLAATVGGYVTIAGGQTLNYLVTSTDKDSADIMEEGEPTGHGVFIDPSWWVSADGKPLIESCQGGWGWGVYLIGADGVTGTYTYQFVGCAFPWVESVAFQAVDRWWFDDQGMHMPADEGSRNDDEVGPYSKPVEVTPCRGWVYGTVKGPGGEGISAHVELYQYGQPTGYAADTDNGGTYQIRMVWPGGYVAKTDAMMGGETNVTVTAGQGAQADITVQGMMGGG